MSKKELNELGVQYTVTALRLRARIEALETAFLNYIEANKGEKMALETLALMTQTYKEVLKHDFADIQHPELREQVRQILESELD